MNIKERLDNYLEFDSSALFESKFNLVRIFGGAIRDSIANLEIHDIDILCGSKAMGYIENVLSENGYYFLDSINGKDLQSMYSEIHIINEPHTWVKGKKIVQLIRPCVFNRDYTNKQNYIDKSLERYQEGFNRLIQNVDLSCCGVSWDGDKLHEDFPNAITHCQSKVFSVNETAWMYSNSRCRIRKYKLIERGWKEIENNTLNNRDLKLGLII
jgi:hypothetical protein